ncbi:MAG: hypothetical protein AAF126_23715, partial [Chloroflexota bacterium]
EHPAKKAIQTFIYSVLILAVPMFCYSSVLNLMLNTSCSLNFIPTHSPEQPISEIDTETREIPVVENTDTISASVSFSDLMLANIWGVALILAVLASNIYAFVLRQKTVQTLVAYTIATTICGVFIAHAIALLLRSSPIGCI